MSEKVSSIPNLVHQLTDVTGKGGGDVLGVLKAGLKALDNLDYVKAEAAEGVKSQECACKHLLDKPSKVLTDVAIGILRAITTEEKKRTSLESIESAKEETKDMHEKRSEQRAENLERQKEAGKAGVWGKVFGWLGAIATGLMALGCLLTPGLQGAAVALLAATALSAMSLTEGGMKALTSAMECIAKVIVEIPGVKALLDKCGIKEEDFIKVCAQVLVIALIVGSSLAAACVTGGASLAGTVAQFAAKAASMAQKIISAVMTHLPRIVKVIEMGVSAGTAATGAAKTGIQYVTTQTEALIKELDALLKDLQRIMESNKDSIQAFIQELAGIWEGASDSIQSKAGSNDVIYKNMV